MQYNETNLPILKYIKWDQPLTLHPDVVRLRRESLIKQRQATSAQEIIDNSRDIYPILFPVAASARDFNSIQPCFDAVTGLYRIWDAISDATRDNIQVVSRTFAKALDSSYEAFLSVPLFKELEGETLSGVLIFPNGLTYVYDFEINDVKEAEIGGKAIGYKTTGNVFVLERGKHLVYDYFEDYSIDGEPQGTYSWHNFNNGRFFYPFNNKAVPGTIGEMYEKAGFKADIYREYPDDEVMGMIEQVIVFHLFRKYAPIETEESAVVSGKTREVFGMERVRTTNPVTYYDCSWYTTIIHTGDFSVRGHWRLQPYGTGRSQKKLIYIHEFQKHGYVRKAKLATFDETKE